MFCCAKLSLKIFITVLYQNNITQLKDISSNLIRLPRFFRFLIRNPSEKLDRRVYWCWMVFGHTKSFKLEVVPHSSFDVNAMLQTFLSYFEFFLCFPVSIVVHSLHIVARTNRHYKRVKCYSMKWTVREQTQTCDVPHDDDTLTSWATSSLRFTRCSSYSITIAQLSTMLRTNNSQWET